jgi:uncharacterized protein (TIGR02118 family)
LNTPIGAILPQNKNENKFYPFQQPIANQMFTLFSVSITFRLYWYNFSQGAKMHKLVILIETTANQEEFEKNWPVFLEVAERMPGLRREVTSHVEHVLAGELPYNIVHELFFDSMQATQTAMASPEGRSAGKLLQSITDGRLVLFFANHTEDSLENITKFRKTQRDE